MDDALVLPDDLVSYLVLNENKDKIEVARQKILRTHFSNSDTSKLQEFLDMELEMMPSFMAWIGRPLPIGWEGEQVSGLSLMYNLMRRVPDLFDSSPQNKKQSRGKGSMFLRRSGQDAQIRDVLFLMNRLRY